MSCDPRDKIYSLLGIASDLYRGDIVVDYSKSLSQVHADVLSFLNRTYGEEEESKIAMMQKASLIRRLLTRETTFRQTLPRRYLRHDWSLESWRQANTQCLSREADIICKWTTFLNLPIIFHLEYRWAVEYARPTTTALCWRSSDLEFGRDWDIESKTEEAQAGFTVTGPIIDCVMPSNVRDIDIIARADGEQLWRKFLREYFPADWDNKHFLLKQNERLMGIASRA